MSIKSAAFLVTGSEILDGRVVDTNSAYLATQLLELGIRVNEIVKIGDGKEIIADRLKNLLSRHDLVMVSGGLGPTTDDVTRDGVAEALGRTLELYPEELARLEEYFTSRGRKFFEQAKQQAFFPKGSQILANYAGSAAGFCVDLSSQMITVTPGPPVELKSVWERSLRPLLIDRYGINPLPTKFFRLFGIPESYVGQAVIEMNLASEVDVSFRAVSPEVHLLFKGGSEAELAEIGRRFLAKIDPFCAVNEDKDLSTVEEIARLLKAKNTVVSSIELMPCGIGAALSTASSAKDIFGGAVVASLSESSISPEDALRKCLSDHAADIAVCVAETEEGSSIQGRFVVAVATRDGQVVSRNYKISGDLPRVRRYAVGTALDCLRRTVLGAPLLEKI